MQGQIFRSEHSSYTDAVTKRVIHQMTSHPSINHAPYFLQSAFTPDGQTLLFTSYRSGCPQLFEVAFPDKPIRQLTNGRAIHPFSPAIHPDGKRILFVRGGSIWMLDRETLLEREIVEYHDAQLGECALSTDGDWIATAVKQGGQHGLALGKIDGSEWRQIPFPRTVIHPQFHPLDPEWLIFAGDPAPRMYRVRRDGTGLECLCDNGNEEFIVHETFLGSSSDVVFTVWPKSLEKLDWHTKQRTKIADFNAWHIAPNKAGTQVLCDTNHPDRGLFLIDTHSGETRPVCLSLSSNQGSQWTQSRYAVKEDFEAAWGKQKALSWMEVPVEPVYGPQWTHPHPSFSPDETKVVFTSDHTGHPQVYVAEL